MAYGSDSGFYSDMFKGVHAKGVAAVLNYLLDGGRLVILDGSLNELGYYRLDGTEFSAEQIGNRWRVRGWPESKVVPVKTGVSNRIDGLSRDGERVFSVPSDGAYFDRDNDFAAFIDINF